MSASAEVPLTRLEELLADRALVGLSSEESAELERLLAEGPGVDDAAYERAAAATLLALVPLEDEPVPASVRARIEADAWRELAAPARPRSAPPPARRRSLGVREALAWTAAAAALALALLPSAPPETDSGLRARLAASAGTVELAWSATDDPAAAGASGEVLWNGDLQQGVMIFRGLAANDPADSQYQLWIFDATRDEAHPVDGGVFDVADASGEVIVPIRAKLAVAEPTLFAVTVERPGGVVVSSRERLPLLAKVGG